MWMRTTGGQSKTKNVCSSVTASEREGDLCLFVDLYSKAVENRYINTTGMQMHIFTACAHIHPHAHKYTHISEELALSAPSKLAAESISPLVHPLLPLLSALCTDPERMSNPSALMPRCRVKHREKLYYSRQARGGGEGQGEAGAEARSVREKHIEGGR